MKKLLLAIPIIVIALMVGTMTLRVGARNNDQLRGVELKIKKRPVINLSGRYIPILMYHHIRDRIVHDPYSVSPKIFDEQMQWLKDHNYHVVRYADFYGAMMGTTTLPSRPVVITFDDGDRDQYTAAFPILKKHGYSAMFYVVAGFAGHDRWMTWPMINKMLGSGMEIGAHSLHHPNLAHLTEPAARYELTVSKKILEAHLHIPMQFFAYPFGAYTTTTVKLVAEAGYLSAVTIHHNVFHPPTENLYLVPRIHIDDDIISFAEFVRGQRR